MKYTTFIITLLFLISLVNLKRPKLNFKSFLSIPAEETDDEEECHLAGTDKDECQAVKLSSNKNQCCFTTSTNSEGTTTDCELFPSPAKDMAAMVISKQFPVMMNEYIGFSLYNFNLDDEEIKERLEQIKMKAL